MTRRRLTDLTLRQLPFTESGQVRYWDETTPGFGVTVGRRTKTFMCMTGKNRKMQTLGRYPEISLSDARKAAKAIQVAPLPKNATVGLQGAVRAFLQDCRGRLRPKTVASYETVLKHAPDIRLCDANRNTVTVRTAHEIKAYKTLLNWCVAEELCDRNPFHHLAVQFSQRTRVLTPDELCQVFHYEDGPYSTIVRLLILTGQRVGEIRQLQPDWIVDDTITIPASIAKNHREHTIPFGAFTATHLKQFRYFNGFSKSKARMDKALDLEPWVLHDLRRSFATIHAEIGTPLPVVEKLLNHVSGSFGGIVSVYQKYQYLKEMRVAASHYEQHMWELFHGRNHPPQCNDR